MFLYYLIPFVFLAGIILIALEDVIKINKAAIAVGMCIVLWLFFLLDATGIFLAHPPQYLDNFLDAFPHFASLSTTEQAYQYISLSITESLGDVSTTLFFVLASMAIIEILDSHGSFSVITKAISATNKRQLIWIVSLVTFFLSALLGNLATVIVMVAVLRKIIVDRDERIVFSGMLILAANAGGCWSPIGDVTTLLLWTGGNLSAVHQISRLILSGFIMMAVPLTVISLGFPKDAKIQKTALESDRNYPAYVTHRFQSLLLIIGLLTLACVPVFQSLFQLPPFMGVLLGLVILWAITDMKSFRSKDPNASRLRVSHLFANIDISTVLFFLGILMSVHALKSTGILISMSEGINSAISNSSVIAFLLGICSSVLDNVALVAATMGMYPITEAGAFMADGSFWTFLAYCAVTGGSILIIGSASGVTVMGMEKITFGYYLKKFTLLALLGYCAGAAVYLLLF